MSEPGELGNKAKLGAGPCPHAIYCDSATGPAGQHRYPLDSGGHSLECAVTDTALGVVEQGHQAAVLCAGGAVPH